MVEAMDIDQNGLSGQATPAESIIESSIKTEDTNESTEVTYPPSLPISKSLTNLFYYLG